MYPVIDPIQTGANIARLRKAAGLTIRELQYGLGVTAQAVRNGAIANKNFMPLFCRCLMHRHFSFAGNFTM
jgi:hypothetical protein